LYSEIIYNQHKHLSLQNGKKRLYQLNFKSSLSERNENVKYSVLQICIACMSCVLYRHSIAFFPAYYTAREQNSSISVTPVTEINHRRTASLLESDVVHSGKIQGSGKCWRGKI